MKIRINELGIYDEVQIRCLICKTWKSGIHKRYWWVKLQARLHRLLRHRKWSK